MAGIRKKGDPYYCTFRCTFRHGGKRFYFTFGSITEEQARAKAADADETLGLLDRGRLEVPEGVSLEDFVAAGGGKVPALSVRPEPVTARQLVDFYLKTHANGTIEENSLGTAKSHLNQILGSLGERFRVQSLSLLNLQDHVERRRKKGLASATMNKEVATFRAC